MLMGLRDLVSFYHRIAESGTRGACGVIILCADDCDAMAACKILTRLLKCVLSTSTATIHECYMCRYDNIPYKVQPVSTYTHIQTFASAKVSL
jgi:hypothetical protein